MASKMSAADTVTAAPVTAPRSDPGSGVLSRSARSLRCMAVYRKPIELRRLNQTGFALMCTVTNLPTAFTNTAPLFVYAKKLPSEVTSRPVWPNKVPACDRSDLEGDVK